MEDVFGWNNQRPRGPKVTLAWGKVPQIFELQREGRSSQAIARTPKSSLNWEGK